MGIDCNGSLFEGVQFSDNLMVATLPSTIPSGSICLGQIELIGLGCLRRKHCDLVIERRR
jgi:hypothetical protein